jgi:hypothetical protein
MSGNVLATPASAVAFELDGQPVTAHPGETILKAAQRHGATLVSGEYAQVKYALTALSRDPTKSARSCWEENTPKSKLLFSVNPYRAFTPAVNPFRLSRPPMSAFVSFLDSASTSAPSVSRAKLHRAAVRKSWSTPSWSGCSGKKRKPAV